MTKTLPAVLAALLLGSCAGGGGSLEPRYVTVHNTLAAMGYAQTGAISEGSLSEGDEARFDVRLRGGTCTTFVALASGGMRDVELRIVGAGDVEIGRDVTHDRQAAAQACAPSTGDYQVVVRAASGSGGYVVSGWTGGQGGTSVAVASGAGAAGPGSCSDPIPLALGERVSGVTTGGPMQTAPPCIQANDTSAPERVYSLEISERSVLSATLTTGYDGALYLLRECGQPSTVVECNDDAPDTSRAHIDAIVEPGVYYLVADGYGNASGSYELEVSARALQPLSAVCSAAPALTPGQPQTGTTEQGIDYFQATCADGARGPDSVYSLRVDQPSRLRVRQQSDHDGVVYVRRDCQDPTTEIACNDDFGDTHRSLVTTLVQPGTYTVISDGFGSSPQGQAGNYTLTADLAPMSGGSATGDECAAPGTMAPGQPFEIDTFEAADDLEGSCGGGGSPDVVYDLSLSARSRVRVTLQNPELDAVAYLQQRCGDAATEVACGTASSGANGATILDTTLAAGSYALVLDGQRADAFGKATVNVEVTDLVALARSCTRAPLLRPGRTVNASTAGESDDFQSSANCAGGSRSPDRLYRIRLTRRSRVRVSMSSEYDGSLHLRSDCVDPATEVACNDDFENNRHARLDEVLDRGTYFLVVDGFAERNAGPFSIDLDVSTP
ncbi:MAG: hypothetical protein AAGH15_15575 [Myxococcota bacterium]